jgi:hypothetical protein
MVSATTQFKLLAPDSKHCLADVLDYSCLVIGKSEILLLLGNSC